MSIPSAPLPQSLHRSFHTVDIMFNQLSIVALALSIGSVALAFPTASIPTGENGLRPTRTRSAQKAKRSDIDSDAVVGFATTVADDTEGTLMEKWWPYLYVVDGCVPFPAVDAEGDTR